MNVAQINAIILTDTAIEALKNAYDKCGDRAAKESILTASNAIIRLHHTLGECLDGNKVESDCYFDPSEYCAAV